MRIVHIVDEPFDPPVSGGDLRNWAISRALGKSGLTTTIAVRPFLTATGASRTERDARTVLEIPYDIRGDIMRRVAGMAPDIVVLGGVGLLRLAETLADHAGRNNIRLIADCHNVESLLLAEIDRAKLSVPIRFLATAISRGRCRRSGSVRRMTGPVCRKLQTGRHQSRLFPIRFRDGAVNPKTNSLNALLARS
jgi:hypothetical protein